MFWRKELIFSDKTFEEKIEIIVKKRERRDYFSALTVAFSFFSSFILLLVLIFLGVFGQFPKNAVMSILIWVAWNVLVHRLVNLIRKILFRKDKKAISLMEINERVKEILRQGQTM